MNSKKLLCFIAFLIYVLVETATLLFSNHSMIILIESLFNSLALFTFVITTINLLEEKQDAYIKLTTYYIILSYVTIQYISSIFITLLKIENYVIVSLAQVIIFTISIILILFVKIVTKSITNLKNNTKQKTNFLKKLNLDIEYIKFNEQDKTIISELSKLQEEICNSDPMSHEELESLEKELTETVNCLKIEKDKKTLIVKISFLIKERNQKCLLLK